MRRQDDGLQQIERMTADEVRAAVRARYESQRRKDAFEPEWIGMFWAGAYETAPDEEEVGVYRSYLKSCARGPHIVKRMSGHKHVQDDGFLVGTTSWIFAARAKATPIEYRGWIIIDRELSAEVKALERANSLGKGQPTRFFMGYNRRDAVGMSVMTGGEIGPCTSIAEVKAYIDEAALDEEAHRRHLAEHEQGLCDCDMDEGPLDS